VVKWVVPDLIQFGKVNRPTLGIELANAQTTQRLGMKGALITHVAEGSAAERAGLRPTYRDRSGQIRLGDSIIGINGEKVESSSDLILILEKFKAGDNVKVKILREEREQEVVVRLDGAR